MRKAFNAVLERDATLLGQIERPTLQRQACGFFGGTTKSRIDRSDAPLEAVYARSDIKNTSQVLLIGQAQAGQA
ncbi:hypothetical protein QEH52_19690 [Coraliomargarita sp. SDUM461003]|uniref:Uncharacterized protein n=1 Tax=Thalassobacterium maritimum TaxID=3041265 RepID=A0ABU1B088_9BACT|nr:hypothetical protein [Coraliomargarita sp. SDUM461003]MDQ8209751.1 hypothetical protein [Coraliomargarita sp. SDUM461003]